MINDVKQKKNYFCSSSINQRVFKQTNKQPNWIKTVDNDHVKYDNIY